MEQETGFVEIKIEGKINGREYTIQDVDISELQEIINDFQSLMFPDSKDKRNRPNVYYMPENGSAKHKFFVGLVSVLSFGAILNEVGIRKGDITFLGRKRAEVFDKFQKYSTSKDYKITISTSRQEVKPVEINSKTKYYLPKDIFVDTEVYLYGQVYSVGGKTNPNIHIETTEYGPVTVDASKEQLKGNDNHLYATVGIRAIGKQNILDGSYSDLKFIDFVNYTPNPSREYYIERIKRATASWSDVEDTDKWLNQLRGTA